MRNVILLLAALAVVFVAPSGALADDDVQHTFSLTISPLHLVLPMGELTGEYRAGDKLGIGGILGFGSATVETSGGDEDTLTLFEVGATLRYYLLGSFIHGMQVGLEALYLHAGGDVGGVAAAGEGLSVGPFIGYKIATNVGFTFDAQFGGTYVIAGAKASDGESSASASESAFGALLNLNIGWSF